MGEKLEKYTQTTDCIAASASAPDTDTSIAGRPIDTPAEATYEQLQNTD